MKRIKLLTTIVVMAVLLLNQGCRKEDTPLFNSPGDLISYQAIDTLTIAEIDAIRTQTLGDFLKTASIKADQYINRFLAPQNPVILYKVTYQSMIPENSNKPTIATGLIALPFVSQKQLPMISYQHGTVFDKQMVPSIPMKSEETMFMISQFAAQGYVLIAADYFGLGDVSTERNSYFVRHSTEQACLDLYKAALQVLEKENITKTKFFINGWSQGGYNTMLFLRRLEKENIKVDAAFTAAGPADPLLAIKRGIFSPRPIDAPWVTGVISNMLISIETYNNYDGLAKQYINKDYYDLAVRFHKFEVTDKVFFGSIPLKIDSLFYPNFIEDAKTVKGLFWQTLSESEAYKWQCRTPLRAYYGELDEVLSINEARVSIEYMNALGKQDATLHNAGAAADHRNTYIESLADAKAWIDGF